MARVVYTGVDTTTELPGTLFEGIKFWLSQKVPQRSRFIDESNGGEVLPLEKNADVKIVDHARKEQLPGTYSYTYIESSVRNGILEDLADHAVGPPEGAIRNIGSITRPAKGTRNKFTTTDDNILWDWVNTNPQRGGGTDGNEIYKQLEAKHPQHPWQSWRDRYIKYLKGRPRPYPLPHNAPPTPPSDLQASHESNNVWRQRSPEARDEPPPFTEEDAQALLDNGADIMRIDSERLKEAWEHWARENDVSRVFIALMSVANGLPTKPDTQHSAEHWQRFWNLTVRPRFLEMRAERNQTREDERVGERLGRQKIPQSKPATATDSTQNLSSETATHVPVRSPSFRPETPTKSSAMVTAKDIPCDDGDLLSSKHPTSLKDAAHKRDASSSVHLRTERSPKRKHIEVEEELPSSSPLQPFITSKRIRHHDLQQRREIPSTPNHSPWKDLQPQSSPLFIENDDQGFETADVDLVQVKDEEISSSDISENDMDYPSIAAPSDVLSERDWDRRETQAIYRERTPFVDFDVPPPDEGWGSEDDPIEPGEADDGDISSVAEVIPYPSTVSDTQAMFRDVSQLPDLELPAPDGGWDNLPPSPPEFRQSEQQAESVASSSDQEAQIDKWEEGLVAQGFPAEVVQHILDSTTLDTALAEKVLESLRKGKRRSRGNDPNEIPDDWKGVWTGADDEDLFSTDARSIARLEAKHGKELLKSRWDYRTFLISNS